MTALYLITFSGLSLAQPETSQESLLEKEEKKETSKKQNTAKKKKTKIPTAGIYFEGGGLETFDNISDDFLGYQQNMTGIRITRDLDKNLTLLASWNMGGTRSDSDYYDYGYYDYDYYEEDIYYDNTEVDSVLTINQVSSGVRYSYRLASWIHPYASAQAVVQHGHLLITDDYDSERPLFEFRSNAFGVGGTGSVGVELRSAKIAKKYKIAIYGEGGYAAMTPLKFGYDSGIDAAQKNSLGQLRFGGAYSRFGIGLKF
jgi:hypothetical protein